jgi:hypothetical protein
MRELTRDEIERVCRYASTKAEDGKTIDPDGGRLFKAKAYEDATGEPRLVVMIDYGVKGLKKMDFGVEELDRAEGKLPPRLEDLPLAELDRRAAALGAQVKGRKSVAKLVVAIQKAEAAQRTRQPAPPTLAEKAEEPKLEPPTATTASNASVETAPPAPTPPPSPDLVKAMEIEVLEAFGEKIGRLLIAGGYPSLRAVRGAPDENLLGIKGIGGRTLESIRKAQG